MMTPDLMPSNADSDDTRGTAAPRVSVVIAWADEPARLGDVLSRRVPRAPSTADTIVVTGLPVDDRLAAAYPAVRFIVAPADCPPSRMRALGLRHAAGDVVMLVDDLDRLDDEPTMESGSPGVVQSMRMESA